MKHKQNTKSLMQLIGSALDAIVPDQSSRDLEARHNFVVANVKTFIKAQVQASLEESFIMLKMLKPELILDDLTRKLSVDADDPAFETATTEARRHEYRQNAGFSSSMHVSGRLTAGISGTDCL